MNYSKLQKIISTYLIFSMLFLMIFRIPFYDYKSYAAADPFHNLVSIIIDEVSYGQINGEIDRYAKNIQSNLENTKVAIFPMPVGTPAFEIASLNESLYFEGYKGVKSNASFESKLVGTILVGDFELPVAYIKDESSKTILPFTDFEDKSYIYNHSTDRYEKNNENVDGIKSEIWHGVISPSTDKIQSLKDYFDKNEDFYTGTGNFMTENGILNGKELDGKISVRIKGSSDETVHTLNSINDFDESVHVLLEREDGIPTNYEPYVFYFDQFREEKAINETKYFGYEGYLENREDLVYNRFSKDLAYKFADKVIRSSNDQIGDGLGNAPGGTGLINSMNKNKIIYLVKGIVEDYEEGLTVDYAEDFADNFVEEYSSLYDDMPLGIKDTALSKIGSVSSYMPSSSTTKEEFIESFTDDYTEEFDKSYLGTYDMENDIDLGGAPDIQTRHIINKMSNSFMEIFAGGVISDFTSDVYNAGRYNANIDNPKNPNMDMIPYIISSLDAYNDEIIKDANTELEKEVDRIVKEDGISRKIAVPTEFIRHDIDNFRRVYNNYFYGVNGFDVNQASDCTIYRGSSEAYWGIDRKGEYELIFDGTLVEANRGTNIDLIEGDVEKLNDEPNVSICLASDELNEGTSGFWGSNSPINLNFTAGQNGIIELNGNVFKGSLTPLFDIKGSTEVGDSTLIPSPLNCRDNNPLKMQTEQRYYDSSSEDSSKTWETGYRVPNFNNSTSTISNATSKGTWTDGRINWYCTTNNLFLPDEGFVDKYRNFRRDKEGLLNTVELYGCQGKYIYLDATTILNPDKPTGFDGSSYYLGHYNTTSNDPAYGYVYHVGARRKECYDDGDENPPTYGGEYFLYNYKSIPSEMTHKSPTAEELSIQINSHFTPSLPIDKTRYIDFISAKGNLVKIEYPNLFDANSSSMNSARTSLESALNNTSSDINTIVKNENPQQRYFDYHEKINTPGYIFTEQDKLDTIEKELYELLKNDSRTGPISGYPSYNDNLDTKKIRTFNFYGDKSPFYPTGVDYEPYSYKYSKERVYTYEESGYPYVDITLDTTSTAYNTYTDLSGNFVIQYSKSCGTDSECSEHIYNVNLHQFLRDKKNEQFTHDRNGSVIAYYKTIEVEGNTKYLDYLDIVSFAIYWKNLSSSEKYNYIFENYLFDQFGNEDTLVGSNKKESVYGDSGYQAYYLPKNKKQYEIAYLGAEGTASGMYIKMDPEGKFENPYSEEVADNIGLSTALMSSSIGVGTDEEQMFGGCSAPEGEMITSWLPAVSCWLSEMLPPSIDFESNKCGPSFQESNDNGNISITGSLDVSLEVLDENYLKDKLDDILLENGIVGLNTTSLATDFNDVKKDFETSLSSALSLGGVDNEDIPSIVTSVVAKVNILENPAINNFSESHKISNFDSNYYTSAGATSVGVSDSGNTNIFLVSASGTTIEDVEESINSSSNSEQKLVLFIDNIGTLPLEVKLYKSGTSALISSVDISDFSDFKAIPLGIEKSGEYVIEIEDANENISTKNIQLVSDTVTKAEIELGSSVVQSNSGTTTNFITLYDRFDNIANSELYDLSLSIAGNNILFTDTSSGNLVTDTIEGYKVFNLLGVTKGTNTVNLSVKKDGVEFASTSKSVKVIDDFVFKIYNANTLEVGGETKYSFDFYVKDTANTTINGFDSRVYITPNSYLTHTGTYFEIEDGVATIDFYTTDLAGEDIEFEFQVEGINQIETITRTINPGLPMKVDISLSKEKVTVGEEFEIIGELKDRYNNLVFNDNSTNIYFYENGDEDYLSSHSVSKGLIKINKTINDPRTLNFMLEANGLENNKFTIKDESGNDIDVYGVPSNAGKVEVFYIWGEDIADKRYNSIYTTLLGSNYGDIEVEDYLGGEILFAKDSRALAVTSLLNDPYDSASSTVLKIGYGITNGEAASNLDQDIKINPVLGTDKYLYFDISNTALGTNIGSLYNYYNNVELLECNDGIDTCIENNVTENDSIYMQAISSLYTVKLEGNDLSLLNSDEVSELTIDNSGKIIYAHDHIKYNYDYEFNNDYISVEIKKGTTIIGKITFKSIEQNFSTTSSASYSAGNSFFVPESTTSNKYYIEVDNNKIIIDFNDPFAAENSLNKFSKSSNDGYENFKKNEGIGWNDGNKSLLLFAAGNTVGDSVKNYMSFNVINLGDPVIKLKKAKQSVKVPGTGVEQKKNTDGSLKYLESSPGVFILDDEGNTIPDIHEPTYTEKQFDSSMGKLLSGNDDIVGYRIFDYNNDTKDDILLLKSDNNLKLLEKPINGGDYIDRGNIAYVDDMGSLDLLHTGNFYGGGFDDIFFVNKDGRPFILKNTAGVFTREKLDLLSDGVKIIRAEVFDMDNDSNNITDIVTLDDFGEIHVFYGPSSYNNKILSSEHDLKLSSSSIAIDSLVYFDLLMQPSEKSQMEKTKLDNVIFVSYPYSTGGLDSNVSSIDNIAGGLQNLDFIKTQYSEESGVKVEKTYIKKGGAITDSVKSGNIINVSISITNIISSDTGYQINDFAYAEKVDDTLTINKDTINITSSNFDITGGSRGYDFLVFNTGAITFPFEITYEAELKPIEYGYLEVGLLSDNNDNFGDVIYKTSEENCGGDFTLFVGPNFGLNTGDIKSPTCDVDKIELPEILKQNTIDDYDGDGNPIPNGIADYIDEMTNNDHMDDSDGNGKIDFVENLENPEIHTGATHPPSNKYKTGYLDSLSDDIDNDGIPNDEDQFNAKSNELIATVGNISINGSISLGGMEKLDEGLDNIQETLNNFNCKNSSCFANPLNWAPLAPGSDPTFMGKHVGDGLVVDEGIPIISGLTWIPIGKACVPTIWPASPLSVGCSGMGAGGYLGVNNPTNFFRIFITPTLTGGMGMAACFGGPASVVGNLPSEGFAPFIPGGNCIVIAKKLTCDEESGGDPASVGTPYFSSNSDFKLINANCSEENNTISMPDPIELKGYLSGSDDFEFKSSMFTDTPRPSVFSQGGSDISVDVDVGALLDGNFEDIIKIQQTRISAFPSWLMDWVTRQVEEIANKLTDFPTIFIIMPDMNGLFDNNWGNESGTSGGAGKSKITSGIKEAYNFIGSIPLVKVEQETVDITIPWISDAEINKATESWRSSINQWKNEVARAKGSWTADGAFDPNISIELDVEINGLIGSIEANLEIIESYKEIPEKINKLINAKEKYLEQILCNIDSISAMLGGRISENGERFKAWVRTYTLIKATLKSWQLIVNIFINFETECHECKNERQDVIEEEFSLVSILMPSIPIVKFPKWPDIIIDLHNIRVGMTIGLPEFNLDTKPILLPSLPKLYLPDRPTFGLDVSGKLNINLPDLPLLPEINIPELPDLPSLPSINLPNLPPPIKLPKMPSAITAVIDILNLIFKAMCILKSLPIHPEWRAGDQIAFLTERNGYLPTDFFEITFPDINLPSFDNITVAPSVNLTFDANFIVEMAKTIAEPINSMSNDFINIFNFKTTNLDFRGITPTSIGVDVSVDGSAGLDKVVSDGIALAILNFVKSIKTGSVDELSANEFRKLINESLMSDTVTSDPRFDELKEVWAHYDSLKYSKEESLIKELVDNNQEKFDTLRDIINTEIIRNNQLKVRLKNIGEDDIVTKVSYSDNKFDLYNDSLDKYNNKFIQTANELSNPDKTLENQIKQSGEDLLNSVETPLENYTKALDEKSVKKPSFLGVNPPTQCQSQASGDFKHNYEGLYILDQGIGNDLDGDLIIDTDEIVDYSYNLFDNLGELVGNEKTTFIDYDDDGDDDIIYFMNNQLFLKENLDHVYTDTELTTLSNTVHVNDNPEFLDPTNNKFFNGSNQYYEAVNNVSELGAEVGNINLGFSSHSNLENNNYRITISDYSSTSKNSIVDGISGIEETTRLSETELGGNQDKEGELYLTRKNLAYISSVSNNNSVKLINKVLVNLQDNLVLSGSSVNVSKGNIIYAGNNPITITYTLKNSDDEFDIILSAYQNIELLEFIKVTKLTNPLYIEGNGDETLTNDTEIIDGILYEVVTSPSEINNYKKPLLPGAKISSTGDVAKLSIRYYDNSELNLDYSEISSWLLYDLGPVESDNFIRIPADNGYYKARVNVFDDNIVGTLSKEALLSPQIAADDEIPELVIDTIQIPVTASSYDLTDDYYENGGVENVVNIIVDTDLLNGTGSSDVLPRWDQGKVYLDFPNLSVEHKRTIGITLVDTNTNTGYYEVDLEVGCDGRECRDASEALCPENPGEENTRYVVGEPTTNITAWQTDELKPCYYECINGYELNPADGTCSTKLANSCFTPQPSFDNATFTPGTPTKYNMAWQGEYSNAPCYYECTNGYTGYDCSIPPICINKPNQGHTSFYDNGLDGTYILTADTDWQNTSSGSVCYYECSGGFTDPAPDPDPTVEILGCSVEPSASCVDITTTNIVTANINSEEGDPYIYNTPWQVYDTGSPCYYKCSDGWTGVNCDEEFVSELDKYLEKKEELEIDSFLDNIGSITNNTSTSNTTGGSVYTQWKSISNTFCDIDDIETNGTIWAGCNSVLGTGVEWDYSKNTICIDSIGNSISCPKTNMSSNDKEDSWNSVTGVSNIWGKFYTMTNKDSACPSGWRLPTSLDFDSIYNNGNNTLKLPLSGYYIDGGATAFYDRGNKLTLWSSNSLQIYSIYSNNYSIQSELYNSYTDDIGYNVRCVKE